MARITIASDHAGYRLKEALVAHLKGAGHDIDDLGTHSEEPVDYPPICAAAGRAVVAGRADFAIVLGGSGQGETMSANKVRGVRAALCHDEYTARLWVVMSELSGSRPGVGQGPQAGRRSRQKHR